MARNRPFEEIIKNVRLESNRSPDPQMGRSETDALKRKINRYYETIWNAHYWPHLDYTEELPTQAGINIYDVPAGIDQEGVQTVEFYDNAMWMTLTKGVGADEYNTYNPDNNERCDPALKFKWRWDNGASQLELWPMPASDSKIRFKGRRVFARMVEDSDVCYLDDNLIILNVAAELLAKAKSPDANKIAGEADKLNARLMGNLSRPTNNKINLNQGGDGTSPVREIIVPRKSEV